MNRRPLIASEKILFRVMEMVQAGKTGSETAKAIGIDIARVHEIKLALGLTRIRGDNVNNSARAELMRESLLLRHIQTLPVKSRVKRLVDNGKTGHEIAKTLGISLPRLYELKEELGLVKRRVSTESDDTPARAILTSISTELISALQRRPELMYDLASRKFEELVAELLKDMGHDVELTKSTRDGGRDILVGFRNPDGLALVECKKYAAHRKIGVGLLRNLFGVLHQSHATYGVVCTTSFLSADATKLIAEREYRYRMQARDFDAMQEWVKGYGQWHRASNGGLWLPGK